MTSDLPAAMRYRNLQKTYKQHVGVFGSKIHGLGLFCVKEIDAGDMVIEYTGTVIRSVLTDKREKIYDSKVCRGHVTCVAGHVLQTLLPSIVAMYTFLCAISLVARV